MSTSTANDTPRASEAWIVMPAHADNGSAPVRVWGLTAAERLRRSLARCGVETVHDVSVAGSAPSAHPGELLLVRGDYFYDERLIQGLVDGAERLLVDAQPAGQTRTVVAARLAGESDPEAARAGLEFLGNGGQEPIPTALESFSRVGAADIAPAYHKALRKHDVPFLLPADPELTRDGGREIENQLFSASYKGVTDFVTKWVFPRPARAVTRQLAKRGVRPNAVTSVSYVLTALAAWLFYEGAFAAGLMAAWIMTFLDTVDGKLARVTLTSTRFGNFFDHGLDLVHPPIWWAAWAYGLASSSGEIDTLTWVAMWIVVVGYVVGRALEGVFLLAFKQEIFTWQRFDAFFRTIIARRNPNLVMLSIGVLLSAPLAGYIAVATWTVACIAIHCGRIGQAFSVVRQGGEIRAWYDTEEAVAGSQAAAGPRS